MHANERGLLLPSAAVAVTFNYRNGMISYLLIIFSCICCNSLREYQFSGGSNGFSVEKGLKKISTWYFYPTLANDCRAERLNRP